MYSRPSKTFIAIKLLLFKAFPYLCKVKVHGIVQGIENSNCVELFIQYTSGTFHVTHQCFFFIKPDKSLQYIGATWYLQAPGTISLRNAPSF